MNKKTDNLTRELRRLDPVKPGELDGAPDSSAAADLLDRIVGAPVEPDAGSTHADERLEPSRSAWAGHWLGVPKLVLAPAALAAVAAIVVLLIGPALGGGGSNRLAAALHDAAAAAETQSSPAGGRPYTYLQTREIAMHTSDADERSWNVLESTTREEWVTRDGAGRLRVVVAPSRFVGSGDRDEWEGAGRPEFLALGFGPRTEDRWLAAGMLRRSVADLPTDPAALAARLRREAEADQGEAPTRAVTLELIAEDLRDPGASPALRRALFEAVQRVPGIEYLGEKTDPEGRTGVAVGVTGPTVSGPRLYSLIFDPDTSQVLASETTSLAPADAGGPTLVRAMVYLGTRGTGSLTEKEGTWLSGIEPSGSTDESSRSYLVYRLPDGTGAE
jgi:hypothetical protein